MQRAYITLLLSQLTISTGGIMARFALRDMGPISIAAWRLSLAAVVLAVRIMVFKRPRLPWRHELAMLGAGALLAEQFATWTLSLNYLTVGNAMLLVCTAPLWNGLYEAFILRRHVPRSFWFTLVAAVGGMTLMVHDNNAPSIQRDGTAVWGVLLALASGLGMAMYFVVMRKLSKKVPGRKPHDTLDLLTRGYCYASVFLIVASLLEAQPLPPLSHWQPWVAVGAMALVTQGIGHTLQNKALRYVRASLVGFSTLLEPLIAAGLAAVLFHETVGWLGVLGGAMVIGALAWALRIMSEGSAKDT